MEKFLIITSFALTPSHGHKYLPKQVRFQLQIPHGNSCLNLWLGTKKVTVMGTSKTSGDVDYVDGFILVILALWPFIQSLNASFSVLGVVNQWEESGSQGLGNLTWWREGWVCSRETFIENQGDICDRQHYRIKGMLANLTVIWRSTYPPPCNGLRGVRCGQKNHKGLHDVRIWKRVVREWRRNVKKQFDHIMGGGNLLQCPLFLFLVYVIFEVSGICTGPDYQEEHSSVVKYAPKV